MRWGACARLVLAALLGLIAALPAQAQDERRLALVIGVDDYDFAPLKNPVRDAELVAETLKRIDFTVTLLSNPTKGQLRLAVDRLYAEAQSGSKNATIFVYFAGHAMQIEQQNYLIPSKADLKGRALTSADFDDQTIHAQWMLRKLSDTGVTRLIFALDACRDNPLSLPGDLGAGTGLAKMSALGGGPDTLILYATQPGMTASDGGRANSPFADALASTLAVPGQSTQDMIGVVREKVDGATGGRQKPYFEGSLQHTFVRRDGPVRAGPAAGGPAAPSLVEQARIDGPEGGRLLTLELLKTRSLADLEQQSAAGDGFASYALGMAYWEGLGGAEKNLKKAARFMQDAVSQGSARGANSLGLLYCCEDQFQRDIETSIGWFEIAAKRGFVLAMRNLGVELTKGDTPIDLERGMTWLNQAAEMGDAEALANLGDIYMRKEGPDYDPAKALELYEASLAAGNPYAAWPLGIAHRWGTEAVKGEVNFDLALQYFIEGGTAGCEYCWKEAAFIKNEPDKPAYYDPEGALSLFRAASDGGDIEARIEYGNLLKKGAGAVPPDPVGAFEAYRSAAAAGSVDGRRLVAAAVSRGEGTRRDIVKAAPELRALLQLDRHPDLKQRHAIYEPNYWALAFDLMKALSAGEIAEAYPGEEAELIARYGPPGPGMKRFTLPISCAGMTVNFFFYIKNWDRPDDETIEGQVSWLKQVRGCDVSPDLVVMFREVRKFARENNRPFTEVAVEVLGTPQPAEAAQKK